MAVMCERVTLPPISSLDFAFSVNPVESRPRHGRSESLGDYSSLSQTHARYDQSSWNAHRPSTSGRPFTPPKYQLDVRSRHSAYDSQPGQSPLTVHTRRASLGDRPRTPPPLSAPGVSGGHHRRVSHARTASQLSSVSADTWSQYDSEHPDSPDVRLRSLSPGSTHYAPHAPSITSNEADSAMRFIHTTPADAKVTTSRGKMQFESPKKRKMDDCSSEDELAGADMIGEASQNRRVQREQADGKRKYKKMMNVRHYRAQTKDALQSLRDVLPESIRPLERQARSFTVVNAVKHIENLTAQLERLQRENQEQAERLQRADARERDLVAKIVSLESSLEQKGGRILNHEERAPAAQQEGDA